MELIVYWLNRDGKQSNINYLNVFDDLEAAHNKYMELKEIYNPETDMIHLVSKELL